MKKLLMLFCFPFLLMSCGFHLQGEMQLAAPLKHLYLQTPDPYGVLAKSLEQYLKMSHVDIVATPAEADSILVILSDNTSQIFLSVNGTQQTRQYELVISVAFEITDKHGKILVPTQTLSESKPITIQSNQILGSSTETTLYYQQMRQLLAYSIINRIASKEITHYLINQPPP